MAAVSVIPFTLSVVDRRFGISFSFSQLETRVLHPASTAGEAKLVNPGCQTTRSILLFENITCSVAPSLNLSIVSEKQCSGSCAGGERVGADLTAQITL